MEEEKCDVLEWEQLRVAGKPLLSGAAFGATPLLWVACRAQPNLVHTFCDTNLQEVWRFPADPVFLAIGSGEDEGVHRLLVITRDGCIWILHLSKTRAAATRPSKKQKTVKASKVGLIQRIKPVLADSTVADATPASVLSQGWKELDVETYVSSAIEVKNVVVADALIGTVPGAKVAAFGPNNYVALGSPAGPPELLCIDKRTASTPEYEISTSSSSREPSCLLAVSSVRHGFADGQAVLSQDLFGFLSGPSGGGSVHEILLIQGGKDGKISTFRMEKDAALSPPHTVYELCQPVVTIIPVIHSLTRSPMDEVRGANWLIVIGVLGKVAFLSSARDQITAEEPNDSPFLTGPVETTSRNIFLRELSGPVSSACLLSGARICYTVGSAVFIAELFHNLGSVLESFECDKLPCQRIPVSNVAAVTGPGLFTYNGSHSLVALTGAGRLLSIKVSKQFAPGMDCLQKAYSGSSVEVLLQSISDAESCRDAIQTHEQALTLAMNELALALPRAHEIATSKKNLTNHSKSKEELKCTLTAAPVPSTSLNPSSFGFNTSKKPHKNAHKNFKTRLDITLMNHSRAPLSEYWSCVLELQSCLSAASPSLQYSFTINNGHGLPVGFQWSHRIHVHLPGGPWGPVMATMYLCHLHDSHNALLHNGRASSAGCVVLLRRRIDLFSLLQGPQSTLGHTSWTPRNTNSKTKEPSLAGETGLLDLVDAEMLGSFSGDLAFSFSPDAKHVIRKPINGATGWQHDFLSTFLQHPPTSTDFKRLRLTSQGGHTATISVDSKRGPGGEYQSVVSIQSPCLLLGILLREAFLCQVVDLDSGNRKKTLVLHRSASMVRVTEIQALVERAREALNVWKKFQGHPAPTAHDLVAPLLGHTYVVTRELIQAYKSLREEPSAVVS